MLKEIITEIGVQFPESNIVNVFRQENELINTLWMRCFQSENYIIQLELLASNFVKIRCLYFDDVSMLNDFLIGLIDFGVEQNNEWKPVALLHINSPDVIKKTIDGLRLSIESFSNRVN